MRKNLNVIAAYSIMMGLIILVGIFQSWNIALSIFNLCLISAVMTMGANIQWGYACLLYTSPSPRDKRQSRMPSSA